MTSKERVAKAMERWIALRDLTIGDDFIGRLVRGNDWSRDHATEVNREYRRFLLVASVASHVVVPPPDIDKAWHEHIIHTRSYAEMCSLIGFTFHHDPGAANGSDKAELAEGYRRTLALYETLFGTDAPRDVWPRGNASPSLARRIGTRLSIGRNDAQRTRDDGLGWIAAVASTPAVISSAPDDAPHHTSHHVTHHSDTVHDAGTHTGHASCGGHSCGGGCGGH